MNVALTRARYGIIVLGNPRVLSRQAVWNGLLTHYRDRGALVEGPLNSLKQSMVQLQRPKKGFDAGSFGLGGAFSTRYKPVQNAGERHEDHLPQHSAKRQGEGRGRRTHCCVPAVDFCAWFKTQPHNSCPLCVEYEMHALPPTAQPFLIPTHKGQPPFPSVGPLDRLGGGPITQSSLQSQSAYASQNDH